MPAVSLCTKTGKRQQVTFERPASVGGLEIDLQVAYQQAMLAKLQALRRAAEDPAAVAEALHAAPKDVRHLRHAAGGSRRDVRELPVTRQSANVAGDGQAPDGLTVAKDRPSRQSNGERSRALLRLADRGEIDRSDGQHGGVAEDASAPG